MRTKSLKVANNFLFSQRMKEARKAAGFTLEGAVFSLGEKYDLHINRSVICNAENEKTLPSEETAAALADLYGVSLEYLTGESSDRNSAAKLEEVEEFIINGFKPFLQFYLTRCRIAGIAIDFMLTNKESDIEQAVEESLKMIAYAIFFHDHNRRNPKRKIQEDVFSKISDRQFVVFYVGEPSRVLKFQGAEIMDDLYHAYSNFQNSADMFDKRCRSEAEQQECTDEMQTEYEASIIDFFTPKKGGST